MTVPTWSEVVRTSEYVPGQPVTADLLNRTYSNMFAVFGLDPDQATVPIFSLPPSVMKQTLGGSFVLIGPGTSSEIAISDVSGVCEAIHIGQGMAVQYTASDKMPCHFAEAAGGSTVMVNFVDVEVTYSSSAPTAVIIKTDAAHFSGGELLSITSYSDSIPLTSTFTTLSSHGTLQAKARATSTQVLLTMKITSGNHNLHLPISVKSFVNKAAP